MTVLELNIKAKPKSQFPDLLYDYIHVMVQVGSRAICNPIPVGTDDDRLVLFMTPGALKMAVEKLEAQGWVHDPHYNLDEEFTSLKQAGNELNLILTENKDFYYKFKAAVAICKKFNVLDKDTRIWVHNKVMYA
jgi:hypothetical protein